MDAASEVSLTSPIKVFDSGGSEILTACGAMIRCKICAWLIPSEVAASHCPFGTDRIEARTDSEAYAPTFRLNAMIAALQVSSVTPTAGKPKNIMKSCTSIGVPRNIQT